MDTIKQIQDLSEGPSEALTIANGLKRKPSYVQSFRILQAVAFSGNIRAYKISRILAAEYYQTSRRIEELTKKGFLKNVKGKMIITAEGILLKEILAQLIVLLHITDVHRDGRDG